jgi:WD40 repeat protein
LGADITAHSYEINQIVTSAKGLIVTSSDDGTVRIWDETTGKQRQCFTHGHWVRAFAVSPDGTKLASSSLDDTVYLWNIATGRRIYKLAGNGRLGGFRAVTFTPDGKHFVTWGDDMYLRKWNVANGKAVFEHKLRPKGVDLTEDEDDFRKRDFINLGQAAFTTDSSKFVMEVNRELHFFEASTGDELQIIPTERLDLWSLAISPDSKLLLAAEYGKNIQAKQPDGTIQQIEPVTHPVTLWDLASGKVVHRLQLPGNSAGPVAFSPDGKLFAAAENKVDQPIRLMETATGEDVGVIKGFRGMVRKLAFTPDGKRLISGMSDTSALVWDLSEAMVKEK